MSLPVAPLADDRLVISLDFGTTYSGVAYAFNVPGKKPEVVAILDWPGKQVYFYKHLKRCTTQHLRCFI